MKHGILRGKNHICVIRMFPVFLCLGLASVFVLYIYIIFGVFLPFALSVALVFNLKLFLSY